MLTFDIVYVFLIEVDHWDMASMGDMMMVLIFWHANWFTLMMIVYICDIIIIW